MFQSLMLVGLGGMIGSMARYLVGILFKTHSLPFGTLVVNLTGSLLIGFLMAKFGKQGLQEEGRLLLVVGLCGGFTTLSALSWENLQFLQSGKYVLFAGYSLLTVIGGMILTAGGYYLGK
jgi:CrcB protein